MAGAGEVHELSRADARRIAVRAQLLDAPHEDHPVDPVGVVRRLTMLQVEPTAAVAPSADVVLWSRLGAAYDPADLVAAQRAGALVELRGRLLPAEDLALHRAEMAAWPGPGPLKPWQEGLRDWVEANDDARRDVLEKLDDEGPLTTAELPDTTVLPWTSSGWTHDRSLRRLLDLMVQRGEVALAGRGGGSGRDPLWDLAERVYPDDPVVPLEEAGAVRDVRRLHALGLARARTAQTPGEGNDVGAAGEPAVVEGVRGRWRVDPAHLAAVRDGAWEGRVALLSPLDRLVFDRRRMGELFDFDYQLEQYKPAAKRRWGYWAMPVLVGDRLVGKLDATAVRTDGVLRVDALHEDEPWGGGVRAQVWEQVEALADWLDLVLVGPDGPPPGPAS